MPPLWQAKRKRRNQRRRRRKQPMNYLRSTKTRCLLSPPHQRVFLRARSLKHLLRHLQVHLPHPNPRLTHLHICRHPRCLLSLPSRSPPIPIYKSWVHRKRRLSPVPAMHPSFQIKRDSSRSSVQRTRQKRRTKMTQVSTRSSRGLANWVKKRPGTCSNLYAQMRTRKSGH